MAVPRLRSYSGPAFLSYGFRPFFLLGSLYAALSILFWVPMYAGELDAHSAFLPVDWHIHEMLFGYLPAIVTGFLLTAIPNWTGRLPVQGLSLLALVVLWLAGRFAVFFSADIGWQAAAVIDGSFLLAVAAAAAREIVAGRNWRNLKVLLPLAVLAGANGMFHIEAHLQGTSDISRRLGMAAAIMLISLIGGRIIPSFTRNWLVRENPGRLPAPFDRFDIVSIAVSALALGAWTFAPDNSASGVLMAIAAMCQTWRLSRWAGERSLRDPLVLILHLAYVFVPIGLALVSASIFFPATVPAAAGLHALGTGAVGAMTLAVMTRATLGHTGLKLRAGRGALFIFVAVLLAGSLRVLAAFVPNGALIDMAGAAWVAAFAGFALVYGTALMTPRAR
ncbi:short-chain dehydrogenase [Mesorhizobium sp. M00.F.Ca.ET.186.01.1.1]|nr:short-chain dehydrogenase [bacterium M00.F.Ca.ET.205.01.1.1]TGU48247.1 short-chain dehydrogenase [bacterium M00.F.Ca.ET.152.01.1.1]TGV32484.1 short-chain dehydrogenase [Mesorhizobium sp. M00.F.Ca.ET.186.01.1.1]TGZ39699.1 short-chain dehydrogenase [bacterium M00.F.Ca.ET.162.01.1.1]TIW63009.1 MAG: short-chain dehydrogenase [Mesorhizobium sp.]